MLYYYEGRKQREIAEQLGIPVNTVKWHLSDAKKELKNRMVQPRQTGKLSVNPIRFTGTGHSGSPGQRGETHDFVGRPLAQNIIFAAYHKPLSVHDIAEELNMPPQLLEGEVHYLAEYDYLTEISSGKFRSNMIVWDFSDDQLEAGHKLYQACVDQIADPLFEALMDAQQQMDATGIYYPEQDYPFLLWTLLPKHILDHSWRALENPTSLESMVPKRKDGGHYIAYASLEHSSPRQLSFQPEQYGVGGSMERSKSGSPLYLWRVETFWGEWRGWKSLTFTDVEECDAFRSGKLPDNDSNRERYAFLLEKGYLRKTDAGYLLNVVWMDSPDVLKRVNEVMPNLSGVYKDAIAELYRSMLALVMRSQPKHLEPQIARMVRGNACGGFLVAYVLKHLVDNGSLQKPKSHQRKTISTWMGSVR